MGFPSKLPDFLNESFKYEENDGQFLFLNDLKEFAENSGKSLMVNQQGDIIQVSKGRLAWENIKGMFGGINHTKRALVEYRFMRLLEYGMAKKWISSGEVLNNIHKIATSHFGLETTKKKTIQEHRELNELIDIISPESKKINDQKPISNEYLQHHQFDLEPHSAVVRLWHVFSQSLPDKSFREDIHDSSKSKAGGNATQEEEGEEIEEEGVSQQTLTENIKAEESGTIEAEKPSTEPAATQLPTQQTEVKTEEKKTLQEEKEDTEDFMEEKGYGLVKIAGIAGGVCLLGAGVTAAVTATVLTAPAVVTVAAAPVAASTITPTVVAVAAGMTATVGYVAKKAIGYMTSQTETPLASSQVPEESIIQNEGEVKEDEKTRANREEIERKEEEQAKLKEEEQTKRKEEEDAIRKRDEEAKRKEDEENLAQRRAQREERRRQRAERRQKREEQERLQMEEQERLSQEVERQGKPEFLAANYINQIQTFVGPNVELNNKSEKEAKQLVQNIEQLLKMNESLNREQWYANLEAQKLNLLNKIEIHSIEILLRKYNFLEEMINLFDKARMFCDIDVKLFLKEVRPIEQDFKQTEIKKENLERIKNRLLTLEKEYTRIDTKIRMWM